VDIDHIEAGNMDVNPTVAANSATEKAGRQRFREHAPGEVDVAIVGAGLGGLMAGATLAREGYRVACFDPHYVAGGCATQFSRGPRSARYHFDVGLHYIGDCGEGGTIPRLLDSVDARVEYAALDRDGFDTLLFPDFELRMPADLELYRDRLAALFPRERRAIDRYVALVRAVMKATRLLDRERRPSLATMASLALDALKLRRATRGTIGEVLDACGLNDPRARAAVLGQSGDYGLPPSQASAAIHLGLTGHYFRGAYYPKGGGQVIADRIAASFERAGGRLQLRSGVERILVDASGAAYGVRLEPRGGEPGQEVRARVVLSNADLKMTLERLVGVEHLPASWVERARGFKMGGALFMTFLGVKADLRALGMRACNYWQFDDYDVEAAYRDQPVDERFRARACYVTSATLKDPEHAHVHAPEGVANVEVMTLVPGRPDRWGVSAGSAERWDYHGEDRYRAVKDAIEAQMIERLDRIAPGAARAIVFRESASPLSHVRFTRATDGTGYGLAATPDQFMKNRPGYRGPLPRLYLCGASTRAGHGIVGALMSGRHAARRIAADLGAPLRPLASI
jgi:phytoene dehydrogenase-like protein